MQGRDDEVPRMHEDGKVEIDRLPPPLARLPRVPHGQVRAPSFVLLDTNLMHFVNRGLMERVEWTDLGFQDGEGVATGAPKAKAGHEPPPKQSAKGTQIP